MLHNHFLKVTTDQRLNHGAGPVVDAVGNALWQIQEMVIGSMGIQGVTALLEKILRVYNQIF